MKFEDVSVDLICYQHNTKHDKFKKRNYHNMRDSEMHNMDIEILHI